MPDYLHYVKFLQVDACKTRGRGFSRKCIKNGDSERSHTITTLHFTNRHRSQHHIEYLTRIFLWVCPLKLQLPSFPLCTNPDEVNMVKAWGLHHVPFLRFHAAIHMVQYSPLPSLSCLELNTILSEIMKCH